MPPSPSPPVTAAPEVVLPSREDPLVAQASEVVGGPAGRRVAAGRSGWWTPLRVMLALVFVVSGLGLVEKNWCRTHGWETPGYVVHACYSDIPLLYYARGLASGGVPYLDTKGTSPLEYPVGTGAVMLLTARLVPDGGDPRARALWYFDINALLIALTAAATVGATMFTAGQRPWDAALVALSPGLLLAGTINWDMWAVMLTALAMLAWARRRPVAAGLWLGLAIATKFYPIVLFGPLFLLCLRAGRLRAFRATVLAAAGSWLVVNVPVLVASPAGWAEFYTFSARRGPGFSSIWYVLGQAGHGVPNTWFDIVTSGSFAVCCALIAALALCAPRRPRLAQLAFLTVAAFLLTNKVYSPQYVVWLVPLAALARPRWRDVLIWQVGEAVHFFGIWYYLAGFPPGSPERALSMHGYWWTVAAHIAGTLWLTSQVVRDILAPRRDPVRAGGADDGGDGGTDDPGGGIFDGAPDVVRLGRRPAVPVAARALTLP